MPSQDTLERFIARVEENAHVEAIEEFYAANASMQENDLPPRVGRETLVSNERAVMAISSASMVRASIWKSLRTSAGKASASSRRNSSTIRASCSPSSNEASR